MIGKIINNYVIERKLGHGGMGNVYFARHNRVDRVVAIKILHQNLFANENIRNRFKNEANALIKLGHPNIVKIYDYVEQDDFACLIMEYIEGYTLDDYITKVSGPLVTAKALNIICKVLDAVQYAHENNIYHRDIKPGNIMLSKDGTMVRIMDFGIAKMMDAASLKMTHANAQLGTPFYMSPEQVKGMPYTVFSDIYSLGVTLFEMVTGKCPYQSITNLFELQSKIVNEPLPATGIYYPDVSPRVQAAIIKATKKKPDQRFLSCTVFKTFLLQDSAPILEVPAIKPKKVINNKPEEKKPVEKVSQEKNIHAPVDLGGTVSQEKNIPVPPNTAHTVSQEKNIPPTELLIEILDKEKKDKRRKIILLVSTFLFLALLISALFYFEKKTIVTRDPPPLRPDTIKINSTKKDSVINDSSTTSKSGSKKDSTDLSSLLTDNTRKSPPNKDHEAKPKPPLQPLLSEAQFKRELEGVLLCNGELYAGHQELNIRNYPITPAEQINMTVGDKKIIYIKFNSKTPGNPCNFQVYLTRRENKLEISPPFPY